MIGACNMSLCPCIVSTKGMPSLLLSPTLCYPIDCSLPASSVHGILQATILEWVVIHCSRGSSRPRDWTPLTLWDSDTLLSFNTANPVCSHPSQGFAHAVPASWNASPFINSFISLPYKNLFSASRRSQSLFWALLAHAPPTYLQGATLRLRYI